MEVRPDQIGVEDVAQGSKDVLDLPLFRGGKTIAHPLS